ncbi:MAG TPA: hypothetical protein VFO60_00890 [Candidatus Dormibacteraeota bacterium]|nr:hypothetical protein [Candidatus Dormibacteraeota bacterium]
MADHPGTRSRRVAQAKLGCAFPAFCRVHSRIEVDTMRSTSSAGVSRRRARASTGGTLGQTADRMIAQIQELVAEIAALREDNEALRAELQSAVDMLERASAALAGGRAAVRGRGGRRARPAADAPEDGRRRAPRAAAGTARSRARATPDSVTPEVVRAAIGKLGTATAREIADEISRGGVPVSGRAIRFLAPAAGARVEELGGERRYRL